MSDKTYQYTVQSCPLCKGEPQPRLNVGRVICNLCGNTSPEPTKGYFVLDDKGKVTVAK
ncbi:hypothetical protein ACI2KR_06690 [Pseudomonas luteola]